MSTKQNAILVGGLVGGVLSTSPLSAINCLCCLGVILGALAGVWYYTNEENTSIEAGDGALLGAGSGVAATLVSLVLTLVLSSIGLVPGTEEQLQAAMQQEGMTPDAREMLKNIAEFAASTVGMIVLTGATALVYAIFGALGGAIGASIFGDDGAEDAASVASSDDF
jgi:hypothetical protein